MRGVARATFTDGGSLGPITQRRRRRPRKQTPKRRGTHTTKARPGPARSSRAYAVAGQSSIRRMVPPRMSSFSLSESGLSVKKASDSA